MSYMGHVLCRSCKLTLCLGKLRRGEFGQPTGFRYAGIPEEQLGLAVLCFLAEHVKHDVIVAGDDLVYEMNDIREYDDLVAQATSEGLSFQRRPCEPSAERRRRLEAGWVHPADRGGG